MKKILTCVLFAVLPVASAFACPLIEGLVDYNCNQKIKIAVTGDSVVAGIGDSANGHLGGYVKRLDSKLSSNVQVARLGFSGIRTDQLLRKFRSGENKRAVRRADLIVIDVGRNDCRDYLSPLFSVRNIKRLVKLFRKKYVNAAHAEPYVVVATQIPDRERRRVCIEGINTILVKRKSMKIPAHLRFDKLPDTILSGDGLHPTSSGYGRMAKKAYRFINGKLQNLMLAERLDQDLDGVFDYFEDQRFETDSSLADSDADGLNDGVELFTYNTNPLSSDTDGDAKSDGEEIEMGTDPLVAD